VIFIKNYNITIKDIAKKANVSVSTVSRVINNKPDVNEKTREKVINIIKKYNYQPNDVARGLKLKETFSIGLVIPDISNPFFPEVARGVEDCGNDSSYSVILSNTDNNNKREQNAIKFMLNKQIDGIILTLSTQNKDILYNLEENNIPVVQLDRNIPESKYPTVFSDNKRSAYNAVSFLIDKGYKKIAHIAGNLSTNTGLNRKAGYIKALEENGIIVPDEYIQFGEFNEESGYKGMKNLIELSDKIPEAVFVANDLMCLGAYEACKEKELSIPEDIAIIGHDNVEFSRFIDPPLTTMAQKKYLLGKYACEKLLIMINQKKQQKNTFCGKGIKDKVLNTSLVARSSC